MFKLYSQRNSPNGGVPEVYTYSDFSTTFRNQLFHIIRDYLQEISPYGHDEYVQKFCEVFSKEKGYKAIFKDNINYNNFYGLEKYIDICLGSDLLDLIDFLFSHCVDNENIRLRHGSDLVDDTINDLNYRFKLSGLGYEFINNEVVKKSTEQTHEHIVKPALKLLHDEDFRGAEEEYLKAFDDYKSGDNKNAILNAIKAFESTMKTICAKLGYTYDKNRDTAQKLIAILESNSFYPSYLNAHMSGIRTTLESGAPTLRNKKAGHGQGEEVVNISDEFVEYALNLVATNMLLLFRIYLQKKTR